MEARRLFGESGAGKSSSASSDVPKTCRLYTDGGARGNPGPAACGLVLLDQAGRTIHASGHFIGRATNNVAEYRGLIFGLNEALGHGVSRLIVYSDSELMIHQLNGVYRVKNEQLRVLYAEAKELAEQFDFIKFEHIRREGNKLADEMVNRAIDAKRDVVAGAGASAKAVAARAAAGAQAPAPAEVFKKLSRFTALCTAESDEQCPGVISEGGKWPFDSAVPAGLCIYAAAGIINAVLAGAEGRGKKITAACARPGCPAKFEIHPEP